MSNSSQILQKLKKTKSNGGSRPSCAGGGRAAYVELARAAVLPHPFRRVPVCLRAYMHASLLLGCLR